MSISPSTLNFGNQTIFQSDSVAAWITNLTDDPQSVIALGSSDSSLVVSVENDTINAGDSVKTWVTFTGYQNITYDEWIYFTFHPANQVISIPVSAVVNYQDSDLDDTFDKWDADLMSVLKSLMSSPYTSLGYTTARDRMYAYVDDFKKNDVLECIYTGRTAIINSRTDANNNNFNAEHTWPQSKFNSIDPMQSDIHHLFPSDATANSQRSNYPFGFVPTATWTQGGSRLGTLSTGGTGFEVRNKQKGNTARAMFYFSTRHQNWANFLTTEQERALRQYHQIDPVDDQELERNRQIEIYQKNRNLFVDHPELINRIWDFTNGTNRASAGKISFSSGSIFLPKTSAGNRSTYKLAIGNSGANRFQVWFAQSENNQLSFDLPINIDPGKVEIISVHYDSQNSEIVPEGSVAITTNLGTYQLMLNDTVNANYQNTGGTIPQHQIPVSALSETHQPDQFKILSAYPNPFNPATTIQFRLPVSGPYSYSVFNLLGQLVQKQSIREGLRGEQTVQLSGESLPSGIYFFRLQFQNQVRTQKLVLIK